MTLNHAFAGWLSWEIAHSAAGSAREHFQYKDLVYLLRMSHQHAFGHGAMYTLMGGAFLFSLWPEKVKAFFIVLPFVGATVDLASWWLMKYAFRDYEWLAGVGGTMFTLGFAVIALRTFYEMWLMKNDLP